MLAPRVSGVDRVAERGQRSPCRQFRRLAPGPAQAVRAAPLGLERCARPRSAVIVAARGDQLGADLAVASPAAADGGISDTISDGAYTFQYTMTGVTAARATRPESSGHGDGHHRHLVGNSHLHRDVFTFGATVMLMGGSTPVTAGRRITTRTTPRRSAGPSVSTW